MKMSNFVAGLQILAQHFDKDGYDIGAEHDEFHVYATDRPLSRENVAKLRELGWFQEGHSEDKDFYAPDEGWMCFT